jgi:hypothetical protein
MRVLFRLGGLGKRLTGKAALHQYLLQINKKLNPSRCYMDPQGPQQLGQSMDNIPVSDKDVLSRIIANWSYILRLQVTRYSGRVNVRLIACTNRYKQSLFSVRRADGLFSSNATTAARCNGGLAEATSFRPICQHDVCCTESWVGSLHIQGGTSAPAPYGTKNISHR